ncbi:MULTISPECIES: PD40 domain-containing protein [unclassified Lysobacter]|uniref:TolB family protein n=1 Tax=unclassified Lysobacter TaxID=2635362 RepID=UPI0006F3DA69|nr:MULTISPECIES: PD40 domain-containing protein [unclassified Lysobacter]KRC36812.1 hypothetical protein ASE10_06885 [Lysobacter sp. Root76]KRD66908.1 hypothetical protein ASE45_16540 [Lysobacter sp. Root96]
MRARWLIPVLSLLPLSALSCHAQAASPQRWTPTAIASDQYESSPTFTPDGRELYFMRSDRSFGRYRLLMSRCENGAWSAPVPPPFAGPAAAQEADPYVSADGRRLYYVSSRGGTDPDDLDIWRVERSADGLWSKPERLPAPVNSTASELLPREDADGTLYFGSSRPGGPGLTDIYVGRPRNGGGWDVSLLGPPISTAEQEYEVEISRDGRQLILVGQRGDGRSHLYRYQREGGRWVANGRVPAREDVFQVGPLLSPRGDRVLFGQVASERDSGELFLADLQPQVDADWPPRCGE